jgi:hypothetical protein
VALRDRLKRLEGDYGPELCEERYCIWAPTFTEVIRHPDGREERIGDPPPPLCASCPERLSPTPRVRHIEVVLDRRGLHSDEEFRHAPDPTPHTAVQARLAPAEHDSYDKASVRYEDSPRPRE